jgi:hypothetical protein
MQLSGNFAPVALSPGNEAPVTIGKETRWILGPVWNVSERKKSLALARNHTIPRVSCP